MSELNLPIENKTSLSLTEQDMTLDKAHNYQITIEDLYSERLRLLNAGKEIFDLSMINPDLAPERAIVDKLVQASLKSYNHRYGASKGLKKLRESFALKYKRIFEIDLDPTSSICVTQGCKDAILQVLKVTCCPGDNVLVLSPTYPAYQFAIDYLGLNCISVPLGITEDDTIEEILSAFKKHKIKISLLNFPHNPTGRIYSGNFWQRVKDISLKYNALLVNDFTYGDMVFSGVPSLSALCGSNDFSGVIEIYSLSKSYSLPGWRVAGLVGDSSIIEKVSKVKSQIDYGTFMPIQIAASYALSSEEDFVSIPRETYHRRAKVLSEQLIKIGWDVDPPIAGACVWAKVSDKIKMKLDCKDYNSYALSKLMLSEANVFTLPGEYFGVDYKDYVRFALVLSEDKIRSAINKLSII